MPLGPLLNPLFLVGLRGGSSLGSRTLSLLGFRDGCVSSPSLGLGLDLGLDLVLGLVLRRS